ncbi:MAG: hypothetical protein JRE64_24645 [Deltaproteobacteria bacterium]|nr:hypothetical protein [Deltaproteobacteria bacterium]
MALFSLFVGVAGGDRPIVVMNAVSQKKAKTTVKTKGDTARLPKGKKPTVKLKTAADMV